MTGIHPSRPADGQQAMSVTRRTFLRTAAAVPIAAHFAPQLLFGGSAPRIVVVGAGAFGGWTALHLRNRGATVTLIDSWGAGNDRSSSGGESRVIRAIYGPDRIYSEMVKRAYDWWEKLDATTEEILYTETGALWLHRGDDAYVRSSVPILKELGFPLEKLTVDEARKRYPQIDYGGVQSIWLEHRAGALYARRACMAVRDAFLKNGGTFRIASARPGAIANETMTALQLADGSRIEADAFVFACGPWLGKLFPDVIGGGIQPTRQEVFFFGTPAGSERYAPSHFPVWIDFGERIFYGIPELNGRGIKIADDTRGDDVDPTTLERVASPEGLARARKVIGERFPELANAPLVESRVCQYENSPDGHLVIDRHPGAKNVWIAGGGSGHGFKLSPAVGEMVADAILTSKKLPPLFAIGRLGGEKTHATQFEVKTKD